ncbi:hypothetical protein ACFLXO_00730 [Chloroflexota bacterium]
MRKAAKEAILGETGCVVAMRDIFFKVYKDEPSVIPFASGLSATIKFISRMLGPR